MKKGFFDDQDGDRSMMRLLAFMVVCTGLFLVSFSSIWMTMYDKDQLALIGLLIGLVTTGLGAKWAQKTTENK